MFNYDMIMKHKNSFGIPNIYFCEPYHKNKNWNTNLRKNMENIVNRTYTRIGQLLKQDISQGIYSIGDKLPTEREISEKFGVSRTIVREAMVMLEVEN